MRPPGRSLSAELAHHGLRALVSVAVWSVWLVLALLLAFQIYLATHHELGVPQFILRSLEERLAESGLQASFGRTLFDPSGRILIRDLRIKLPGFEEPVVTAKAVYGRLNWWDLLASRFDPVEVRVTGLAARVPASLSPSGRADEIVHDVDATLFPRGAGMQIPYVTGYLGTLKFVGQGTVPLPNGRARAEGPLPLTDLITRQYAQWSRQAAASSAWLAALDNPSLRLELVPVAPGISRLDFVLSAAAGRAPAPWAGELTGLRVSGGWVLGGGENLPEGVQITARRAVLPGAVTVEALAARARLAIGAGPGQAWSVSPAVLDFTARRVSWGNYSAGAPVGQIDLSHWPQLAVDAGFWLWGQPQQVSIAADSGSRTGAVKFAALVGPGALEGLRSTLQVDLASFLSWTRPMALQGSAQFGAGGKFQTASAELEIQGLSARGVQLDEVRAELSFDGQHLLAPHAYARLGDDYARGSFEQDLATNHYRMLLDGRLRPLRITPWIAGTWWHDFFSDWDFPTQGPDANIDLSGSWTDGLRAKIFLRVDVPDVGYRHYAVNRLRGRLFSRPQFNDVLAFTVERGGGKAEGQFARRFDLAADDWSSIDATLTSTLEPMAPLALAGPETVAAVSDFVFDRPPHLAGAVHFDGPAVHPVQHRKIAFHLVADGPTTYRQVPIEQLAFDAALVDDDLNLTGIEASIAGGPVAGHMALTGPDESRTLEFSGTARDLSLTRAAGLVQKISAQQPGAKTEKFLQDKSSVKIDAIVTAKGQLASLQSFHGSGTAQLHGGEIGEMRILGALSQLLRFTALRFTGAEVAFQLDGSQLNFPSVVISGARAAITAHGQYSMALHQLDFRARLDPFKESRGTTRGFMDLALTSLASALEVRLTGSVDHPKWAFVNGPTNLLWSLRGPNSMAAPKPSLPIPFKPAS